MYEKKILILSLSKPTPYPVATGLVTAVLGILAVILWKKENMINKIQIKFYNTKWKSTRKYRFINKKEIYCLVYR